MPMMSLLAQEIGFPTPFKESLLEDTPEKRVFPASHLARRSRIRDVYRFFPDTKLAKGSWALRKVPVLLVQWDSLP